MSITPSKVNIYCPIETINRELDFRLFFAAQCVRPGIRFVIGQRFTMYELLKEMHGGLYVGQSIRPRGTVKPKAHQVEQVETLRARGTTLMVLDEEGGVMAGDEERWKKWLDLRIDIGGMKSHEHVCTWGDFQRDYYKSQDPPCRDNIVTTGHPRFDLYKPKYREYYAEEAGKWKEKYGDFVLVNTNFAWSNHARGDEFVFGDSWHLDPQNEDRPLHHIRQWAHKNHVWTNFVSLVTRLGLEMPQLNIVIRPHPSERIQFYREAFRNFKNIHVEHEGSVGPWLLASRALIHDGCTTAIEAHFCGVPILNYKSVIDERYDLELPNSLGLRCESEEKLLEALQAILKGDAGVGHTKETPAVAKKLIDNFQHDSFTALTEYVQTIAEKAVQASVNDDDVLKHHQRHEKVSGFVRNLKTKRHSPHKTVVEKFYGFENTDLLSRFEKVQRITNRDLKIQCLSGRVILIEA